MVENTTADADTEASNGYTAEQIRERFQNRIVEWQAEHGSTKTPFVELFTPRARALILDALIGAHEPLTAAEICEHAGIDRSTFSAHEEVLGVLGVLESPGKKGNARVYTLDTDHPAAQLLIMLDTVIRHGRAPLLLEEQFIGDPAELDADDTVAEAGNWECPECGAAVADPEVVAEPDGNSWIVECPSCGETDMIVETP